MAQRTVKVGLMSYVNADGVQSLALLGEKVDVNADDVDRFDRLNGPAEPEPVEVEQSAEDEKPRARTRKS